MQISEYTNSCNTGGCCRCSSCTTPILITAIIAAYSLAGYYCRRYWRAAPGRQSVCYGAHGDGATGTNRDNLSRVVLQRFLAASWRDDQFHSDLQSDLDCLLVDALALFRRD